MHLRNTPFWTLLHSPDQFLNKPLITMPENILPALLKAMGGYRLVSIFGDCCQYVLLLAFHLNGSDEVLVAIDCRRFWCEHRSSPRNDGETACCLSPYEVTTVASFHSRMTNVHVATRGDDQKVSRMTWAVMCQFSKSFIVSSFSTHIHPMLFLARRQRRQETPPSFFRDSNFLLLCL